jgi:tRNA (guanine-N7-)-methyltransferase
VPRPNKLKRYAELGELPHVFEPDSKLLRSTDYAMKGKWNQDYFNNKAAITLELGCGKGEYTVGLGSRFPQRNFIGLDIKGARMWKGAKASLRDGLDNVAFLRIGIEFIDRVFSPDEVDEIWITFPDPQPKKAIKRLMSSYFLTLYQKILVDQGVVHLKTDSRLLHEYLLALLRQNRIEPELATADLYLLSGLEEIQTVKTFYEQSFLAQGKSITYIRFRLPKHVQLKEVIGFDSSDWDG